MTTGLVVNELERAGIATVCVGTMRKPLEALPRVIVSRYPRARNFGEVGDAAEHRRIAEAALALLHSASEPALRELRAGDDS